MIVLGSGANTASEANSRLQLAKASVYASLTKLSSGSRIVNAADDAGGLAVQMKMAAAFRRLGALENNLLNALSFKQVQQDSLQRLGSLLERMSELKTLSVDPTKNASDRANYSQEYSELASEIRKLDEGTFNGIRLFSDTSVDQSVTISSSEDGSASIVSAVPSLKVSTLKDVACEKTYRIVSGTMEWSEAEADAVSKGGHLAQFKSDSDWDQAVYQLGSALTAAPLWIGLKQDAGAAMAGAGWKWVTGESLAAQSAPAKWAGGQPDNGGAPEAASPAAADALVWNQPAAQCATFGHLGDELASNADGVVSGYVIQYTDNMGATRYKAVQGASMTWDQARLAAYHPSVAVLPGNTSQSISNYSTASQSTALSVSSTAGLSVGMSLNGALVAQGAKIVAIDAATNVVTMSLPSTAAGSMNGGNLLASMPQDPHLATLKTAAEYSAARSQLQAQGVGTNEVLWLGGYQAPSGVETDPAADWHWVASLQAGDSLVHPGTDESMSWSSDAHAGQPDNLSSSAVGESVAYMSGGAGQWSDSTQNPNQGASTVSGYLLQIDTLLAVNQTMLGNALEWVAGARAQCGADMALIRFEMDRFQNQQLNLDAARSRISDVDVASESGRLSRSQVLVQAAANAVVQANASSQTVLRLLG
jgi:flagellin-like hook-associated protein FlgL